MAGNRVTSVDTAKAKKEDGSSESRQRSTIAFPYNDLAAVEEMAHTVHGQVGNGECDDHQLAAWTDQSSKSSAYRVQLSAAKMFGVIETPSPGHHRLTGLGKMIVDPQRAREARVQAFLNVPLYSAIYEKYKGGVIPPAAALERDVVGLGVAEKVKDRARRTLERSSQQAGFQEQGTNRLVKPGVADLPSAPSPPPEEGNRSGGSGFSGHDPMILGLFGRLPNAGAKWSKAERQKWLTTAENIFGLIYDDGGSEPPSE